MLAPPAPVKEVEEEEEEVSVLRQREAMDSGDRAVKGKTVRAPGIACGGSSEDGIVRSNVFSFFFSSLKEMYKCINRFIYICKGIYESC